MDKQSLERFELNFPFAKNAKSTIKIVIGEQPYKQSLNGIPFAVRDFSSLEQSKVDVYRQTGHVAFFVSDWIKIQDSLEMIFNLLAGHKKSLFLLGTLRAEEICPAILANLSGRRRISHFSTL